ncbi:MAG: hypothetical protein ACD_17C00315G0001, partial [uncultured bacterium]
LFISFLDNFGYSIVFILFAPVVLNPDYGFFSQETSLGTKNIYLGILVGIFPLALFFGAPFWGDVGDFWGRRRALLWTILGTVFGHVMTALAMVVKSFAFLLIARAVAGLFAGNVSIALATISDISKEPKLKARNFGLLTVALGSGWILAMLLGGYLSDPTISSYFSPELPFYVVAALTFVGFLVVKYFFIETHKNYPTVSFDVLKSFHEIKEALKIKEMRPILYVLFFWSMGWFYDFQWFTPISLESYHVTQEKISSYLLVLGISWILGGVFLNPFLVQRFSSRCLSIYTVLLTAVLIFLSLVSKQYFFFGFWFWMSALLAAVTLSNLFNLVALSAPSRVQGKAMGFSQSFQALAGFVVPFLGGAIANVSISWIYPLSFVLLLFSFFLLLRN